MAATTILRAIRPAHRGRMGIRFVAQLDFVRESWTAPLDVERLRPAQDADEVADEQIGALLGRLEEGEALPLFVFDAGYEPVKAQRALEGSACQILVRLRAVALASHSP